MPATRHPACCPLASPLPDSAVLAAFHSGRDYRRVRPQRRRHGDAKPDSRLPGGVATAEPFSAMMLDGSSPGATSPRSQPRWPADRGSTGNDLGLTVTPPGNKSEITLDQRTSAKTEVEHAGGRSARTVHELTVSGIGLPARSSRRTRIAQTVMRKASTAIPAATRNPLEKPTANA
jgi:hypothetical protein